MKIFFVSIFPEIFNSFVETSLISKARDKKILDFEVINPRDFCKDKHRQIDDIIYGGGAGMLMKVEPVVLALEDIINKIDGSYKIVYVAPSKTIFNQGIAHSLVEYDNIIFVCGRYEGIDYRFVEYMKKSYKDLFEVVSLGQFVVMGGETPAMVMTEAITRLLPGVIKESDSRRNESYNVNKDMQNIEYPQYTRPSEWRGMKVPEVLLSGHHKKIEDWRGDNEGII